MTSVIERPALCTVWIYILWATCGWALLGLWFFECGPLSASVAPSLLLPRLWFPIAVYQAATNSINYFSKISFIIENMHACNIIPTTDSPRLSQTFRSWKRVRKSSNRLTLQREFRCLKSTKNNGQQTKQL